MYLSILFDPSQRNGDLGPKRPLSTQDLCPHSATMRRKPYSFFVIFQQLQLGMLQVLELQKEMRSLVLTNPSLMPEVDIKQQVPQNSRSATVATVQKRQLKPLRQLKLQPSRSQLPIRVNQTELRMSALFAASWDWGKSASSAWFTIFLKRSFCSKLTWFEGSFYLKSQYFEYQY